MWATRLRTVRLSSVMRLTFKMGGTALKKTEILPVTPRAINWSGWVPPIARKRAATGVHWISIG